MTNVECEHATDPIDWACFLAETAIQCLDDIRVARFDDPAAFPGYHLDLTPASFGRQIVGRLLDAGWTPPTPHNQPIRSTTWES